MSLIEHVIVFCKWRLIHLMYVYKKKQFTTLVCSFRGGSVIFIASTAAFKPMLVSVKFPNESTM